MLNGLFRVRVKAKLRKRDPKTHKVLEEVTIPEHRITNEKALDTIRKGGTTNGLTERLARLGRRATK